ncbi:MAG: hypothetical protein ABFQ95_04375 [Pseudomonadota bacterium]
MSEFAVIYQGFIKEGSEDTYKACWNKIAQYFIASRGAIGSCLHKVEDGSWLAYSRWPDKETRDQSWPGEDEIAQSLPDEIVEAIKGLKACIDHSKPFTETCMQLVEDYLV